MYMYIYIYIFYLFIYNKYIYFVFIMERRGKEQGERDFRETEAHERFRSQHSAQLSHSVVFTPAMPSRTAAHNAATRAATSNWHDSSAPNSWRV